MADTMQGNIFHSWFASQIGKLYETEPLAADGGALLGLPVWGERYIERLTRYCLPSLLTPANSAALRKMGASFVFFTDDVLALWRRVAFLERAGFPVRIHKIAEEVIKAASEGEVKYLMLGAVQNICVQMAARSGRGFYMLMPDVLYAAGYFESLERLARDHEAIVQNAPALDIEAAAADIEGFRSDGALTIPALELGDLCWKHLHQAWRTVLADTEGFRHFNIITWRARDGMHMASPFMAPVWLGPQLCREAPVVAPAPLDTEVPALAPRGWCIPGPSDGMTMIELSDSGKHPPSPASFEDFMFTWWRQMSFTDAYLAVAAERYIVPMSPVADATADSDIEKLHAGIITAMGNYKPRAMEKFLVGTMTMRMRLMQRHGGR